MSHPEGTPRIRVLVAGTGDTGLLTAINLSRHRGLVEVVGVSSKAGLVSGKDLGWRLARPEQWAAQYNIPFGRYRALDRVRLVHGSLIDLDPDARVVTVRSADGTTTDERYGVLVLATGVRNGFWRSPELQGQTEIDSGLRDTHARFAGTESIAVVGGAPAHAQDSVLDPLHDGLEIFTSTGRRIRLPRRPYFAVERHLVGPLMYRGIRPAPSQVANRLNQ